MNGVHLVMPMAGRGSRFSKAGFERPKPLLRLHGQPLFWWAVESVRREVPLRSLTAVVLQEHVERFRIDRHLRDRYPDVALVVLPEPTPGALVTAMAGCRDVPVNGTVIFNDCDHAFDGRGLRTALPRLEDGASGMLCHFRSRNPAYSYAEYAPSGWLLRTVEKQAISEDAIAGAYAFCGRDTFLRHARTYLKSCPYDEPFMSGVYNTMVEAGAEVRGTMLDRHVSFGTPDEYARAGAPGDGGLGPLLAWRQTEATR